MSGVVPVVPRFKFTDANGNPLANGSVTVYLAGTTTLATTYQDKSLSPGSANTNPVTLDGNGECLLWTDEDTDYKFLLKDSSGATVSGWPVDNISTSGLGSFLQAGTGAVSRSAQSKMRDFVSAKDFGVQGGGADDTAAIQSMFDTAPLDSDWYFPDNGGLPYKITTTITASRNGITIRGPRKNGFEKVAIYCTTNAPILQITGGAVRVSAEDIMFLGDKSGNRTGSNPNSEPLLYVANGAANTSMLRFTRCDFRRGDKLVQIGGEATSSLHFEECAFYNGTYGFVAPEGVDNVYIVRCNLEGLTTPFDVSAGKLGHFVLEDCYLEANATDPVSVGVLKCSRPVILNNKLNRVRITWGKGVSNPTVHGNRVFGFGAAIDIPPLFTLDMDVSGMTHSAPKRHGGGRVLPLSFKDHLSAPGFVAGDGLDYVIVTNAQRKALGASSPTVQFLVDAGVISSDVLPFNAIDDQYGSGGDLTTMGVVSNTGGAISCTALASVDYLQKTTIYQSLLQNGTFPGASIAKWTAQGGIVAAANGAYLRLTNPGASGNFVYNRVVHVPTNCKQVWTLARVKTGQGIGNLAIGTGLFGGYTNTTNQQGYAYCSVQVGYFDNGDGTTDDLVSVCANVLPGAVLAKATFGISVPPGSTFDIRWVCAVPVVEEGQPIYAGTFTWDPPSLAAGANTTTGIGFDTDTATDLKQANVGDFVRVIPPYTLQGLAASAYVSATSSMTARLDNPGAGAVDLASGVWRWELVKQ